MPVLSQYQQEIPVNHLDLPPEALPEKGQEMETLFDKISRWVEGKSWQLD